MIQDICSKKVMYKKHVIVINIRKNYDNLWYASRIFYNGELMYFRHNDIGDGCKINKVISEQLSLLKETVNKYISFDMRDALSKLGVSSCMKKRIERRKNRDVTVEYTTLGRSRKTVDDLRFFLLKNGYDGDNCDVFVQRHEGDYEYCFGFGKDDYEDKVIYDTVEITIRNKTWTW